LVAVVPITGTAGSGALYPRLSPGRSGLVKLSYALVDQVRSVDKRRITRVFGTVSGEELAAVDEGLTLFLGLDRG
jgi:mRNA-degrading endonuclease toxin of MazEF toxin-antitoxin module